MFPRLRAVLISARCEKACGKLPSWRRSDGSYSSAGSPTLADGVSRTRSYLQYVFDLRRDSEFASLGITRDCFKRRALI